MGLTCGFYNSLEHDRLYDANQISSIFDGVIYDGVYETIGDKFIVKASTGMDVLIGSGRAWFDHTWSYNDSDYKLTLEPPHSIYDRIDAIVLEVNHEIDVRNNNFKIVKGENGTRPIKPTLIFSDTVKQYPLAYITVKAGVDTPITQANIENCVGTSSTPFVTGVNEGMNIDALIAQWRTQFAELIAADGKTFDDWMEGNDTTYENWFNTKTSELQGWFDAQQTAFLTWFNNLKITIDDNIAVTLQAEIEDLNGKYDGIKPITEEAIKGLFN